MSDDRSEYVVDIFEIPHTMLLNPQHAAWYGEAATPVEPPVEPPAKAKAPANKAHTPANKSA